MIEDVRELYAYNRWANGRILEAVSRLDRESFEKDLGSSFPSVRDTLTHILAAEWVWLSRWMGRSPTGVPDAWDLATLEALRAMWAEVERDQEAFLLGLSEEDLDGVIEYRDTKGQPFSNPLREMLRHVVNHSTYHRGQVVTMLRRLGAEPPSTDLIRYYRERAGSPAGTGRTTVR